MVISSAHFSQSEAALLSTQPLSPMLRCIEKIQDFLYWIWDSIASCFTCCGEVSHSEEVVEISSQSSSRPRDVIRENFCHLLQSANLTNRDLEFQLGLLPPEVFRETCALFFQSLDRERIHYPEVPNLSPNEFIRIYLMDPRWFQIYRETSLQYLNQ